MFVLQYHLTSGIYVSKFQPQPRKCQREERGSMRKWGGGALLTQEWVIWMMPNPNCTKCTGKWTGCQRPEMSSLSFLQCCSHLCLKGNNLIKIWIFFSRNTLIKRTSWSKSRSFEATFNLLCLLIWGLMYGDSRPKSHCTHFDSKYQRWGSHLFLEAMKHSTY